MILLIANDLRNIEHVHMERDDQLVDAALT
jgi:hypothetical protein